MRDSHQYLKLLWDLAISILCGNTLREKNRKKGASKRRASETSNDKNLLDCKKQTAVVWSAETISSPAIFTSNELLICSKGEVERGRGTNRAVVGVRSGEEGGWEGPIDS